MITPGHCHEEVKRKPFLPLDKDGELPEKFKEVDGKKTEDNVCSANGSQLGKELGRRNQVVGEVSGEELVQEGFFGRNHVKDYVGSHDYVGEDHVERVRGDYDAGGQREHCGRVYRVSDDPEDS